MDWNATFKNVGIHGILVLLVFIIGPALTFPSPRYRRPIDVRNVAANAGGDSSASVAEILRNIQKILTVTKPFSSQRKLVKQEAEGQEGAANALAYLTDSFGGQLAGQILSVILSSVTGDVRGILGNSLNLFQTEESRDRVQLFLDDLSQNFLKFTGLQALVTTKSPLQQSTLYPGGFLVGGNNGQAQLQGIQPSQAIPVSSLGSSVGSAGSAYAPASASAFGSGTGGLGFGSSIGSNAALLQQQQQLQKPQQATSAQQQPIIYVLPQLANGGTTGSGASGTKTTGNKATVSTNTGDDDSEEDRKLWSL